MGNGDTIGINGKFSVCSPVNFLPDLRADAGKHDVVEEMSSTSNDRCAEEGFRPFEVHELTLARYRDDTACRDVEVLVERQVDWNEVNITGERKKAIAYTDTIHGLNEDSIWYWNTNGSKVTILKPYRIDTLGREKK